MTRIFLNDTEIGVADSVVTQTEQGLLTSIELHGDFDTSTNPPPNPVAVVRFDSDRQRINISGLDYLPNVQLGMVGGVRGAVIDYLESYTNEGGDVHVFDIDCDEVTSQLPQVELLIEGQLPIQVPPMYLLADREIVAMSLVTQPVTGPVNHTNLWIRVAMRDEDAEPDLSNVSFVFDQPGVEARPVDEDPSSGYRVQWSVEQSEPINVEVTVVNGDQTIMARTSIMPFNQVPGEVEVLPGVGTNLVEPRWYNVNQVYRDVGRVVEWRAADDSYRWDSATPERNSIGDIVGMGDASYLFGILPIHTDGTWVVKLANNAAGSVAYDGVVHDLENGEAVRFDVVNADIHNQPIIATVTSVEGPLEITVAADEDYPLNAEAQFNSKFEAVLSYFEGVRLMDWTLTNRLAYDDRPSPKSYDNMLNKSIGGFFRYDAPIRPHMKWVMANVPDVEEDGNLSSVTDMIVESAVDQNLTTYLTWSNEVWNGMFRVYNRLSDMAADNNVSRFRMYGRMVGRVCMDAEFYKDRYGHGGNIVATLEHIVAPDYPFADVFQPEMEDMIRGVRDAGWMGPIAIAINTYFGSGVDLTNVDRALTQCEADLDNKIPAWREFVEWARANDITPLVYEGGQHVVSPTYDRITDPVLLQNVRTIIDHPRMRLMYSRMISAWQAAGGGPFAHFTGPDDAQDYGTFGLPLDTRTTDIRDTGRFQGLVDGTQVAGTLTTRR